LEVSLLIKWRYEFPLTVIRVHLGAVDLNEYFEQNPTSIEDLLNLAKEIYRKYLTTAAAENARYPDSTQPNYFTSGSPWSGTAVNSNNSTEPLMGDQVLSNSILRMRDSVLHYEFQCAIADGDIGRVMNVMAVSRQCTDFDSQRRELTCN
jgi:hypothetical protein